VGHLNRIKSRRADIPNPDIPVRIQFVVNKIDSVCNGEKFFDFFQVMLKRITEYLDCN